MPPFFPRALTRTLAVGSRRHPRRGTDCTNGYHPYFALRKGKTAGFAISSLGAPRGSAVRAALDRRNVLSLPRRARGPSRDGIAVGATRSPAFDPRRAGGAKQRRDRAAKSCGTKRKSCGRRARRDQSHGLRSRQRQGTSRGERAQGNEHRGTSTGEGAEGIAACFPPNLTR